MRHMVRLNRIERMRRRLHPQPEPDVWIYYDPTTCRGGIEDTTNARNARTGELCPIAALPVEALRVIISYDRE